MDFYAPLPESTAKCKHILVTIDAFSKYVELYPMANTGAKNVVDRLVNDHIPNLDKPKRVLLDHGTQFPSPILLNKLDNLGMK